MGCSDHSNVLMNVLRQGFGWAIAKALAEAGAEISLGVWVSHPLDLRALPSALIELSRCGHAYIFLILRCWPSTAACFCFLLDFAAAKRILHRGFYVCRSLH